MEDIFKVGDRVYCILHGWGEVLYADKNDDFGIHVRFSLTEEESFTHDGRFYLGEPHILSFTEYTLEGFSQERPEELPNKGAIVWVRAEFPDEWTVGHFFMKKDGKYYISYSPALKGWHTCGVEFRTTNPYENEN